MFMLNEVCKEYGQTPSSYVFQGCELSGSDRLAVDKEVLIIARSFKSKLEDENNQPTMDEEYSKYPQVLKNPAIELKE